MNKTIDPEIFKSLGLKLSSEEENSLVEFLQKNLEERVGLTIITLLPDQQSEELVQLAQSAEPEKINEWVTSHLPEYKDIVQDEYDILIGDFAANPKHFLELAKQ